MSKKTVVIMPDSQKVLEIMGNKTVTTNLNKSV